MELKIVIELSEEQLDRLVHAVALKKDYVTEAIKIHERKYRHHERMKRDC